MNNFSWLLGLPGTSRAPSGSGSHTAPEILPTCPLLFYLLPPRLPTAHDNSFISSVKKKKPSEGSSLIFPSTKLPAFVPLCSFPPASGMKCPSLSSICPFPLALKPMNWKLPHPCNNSSTTVAGLNLFCPLFLYLLNVKGFKSSILGPFSSFSEVSP